MRLFFLLLLLFGVLLACAPLRLGYVPRDRLGPGRSARTRDHGAVSPVDPATDGTDEPGGEDGVADGAADSDEGSGGAGDGADGPSGTEPPGEESLASTEEEGSEENVASAESPRTEAREVRPGSSREILPDSVKRPEKPRGPQGEDAHLLYRVNLALDLLEAGAVPQAIRIVDQLTVLFPEKRSAELFQVFLRRRHPSLRESRSEGSVVIRDTDAALKAHAEGRELLEENKSREALLAFERAYSLDPENSEIAGSLVSLLKNTGLELYSKGEWSEAISYWRRALEIAPADSETLRFLSRAENIEKQM